MNSSARSNAILALFLAATFRLSAIEGCHSPYHGRHKRAVEPPNTPDVQSFFPGCFSGSSQRNINWEGPVDFVIKHSSWYSEASEACSPSLGLDSVQCWLQQINDVISAQSPVLNEAKSCIIAYSKMITGKDYTGPLFPSNHSELASDDGACPTVVPRDFLNKVESDADYPSALRDSTDDTILYADDVIDALQHDIICPTCTCTNLLSVAGSLQKYQFESEQLDCDDCWSTRLGSMVTSKSELARPFARSSMTASNLKPVTDPVCQPATYGAEEVAHPDEVLDPRIECLPNQINLRISRCALINFGFDFLEEFLIGDRKANRSTLQESPEECEPHFYSLPGLEDVLYTIEGNLDQCGAIVEQNETHVTYFYEIRTVRDDIFTDDDVGDDIEYEFSCTYLLDDVTNTGHQDLTGKFDVRDELGEDDHVVHISLFRDPDFNEPITTTYSGNAPTLAVPRSIYVDIYSESSHLMLLVPICVLSNTYPVNLDAYIEVIINQCAVDLQSVLASYEDPDTLLFTFPAFQWGG
ncbi:uncharacterized protein LOC143445640 [Clavelina lepadiformis]|uniref:uncharacterized protein LOC143445640 n=1 Tax=Clavelina lepadiformis TaxID=159417 RepID=UPI004043460D